MFPTLREAIHATATGARQPMKALAADLDWSPSELSMRTTLGGDNGRTFPASDEHLIRLMRVTGDYSILYTIAELTGYEVQPKRDRMPEIAMQLRGELADVNRRVEQLLLNLDPGPGGRKR